MTLHDIEVVAVRCDDDPPLKMAGTAVHETALQKVAVVQNGTNTGRAAVGLVSTLPDGTVAVAYVSASLFAGLATLVRSACLSWGEDNEK